MTQRDGLFEDDLKKRDPQPADVLVLWLPVFMCCGIGTYFLLPFEPSLRAVLFVSLALCICMAGFWRYRDWAIWRWVAGFVTMFCGGILLIQVHSMAQAEHVRLLNYSVWNKEITGRIGGFERVGTGWRVVMEDAAIENGMPHYTLRLTVRKKDFMPQEGALLTVKGSVMAPSEPMVPHSFDFRRHAFYRGISGYGYATQVLSFTPPPKDYHADRLEHYRDWLTERVYTVLQQPDAGIVTALLNGQRAGITKKSTAVLQQSGLQHVISISGLHVSLMAITVFFAVRLLLALNMRVALYLPTKKIAAFCALIGIVFYLLIVGNTPPTLRAVLVTGAALCAVMLDREPIQMRVVALAALAILLVQPESLVDIGFQMSFAAVIGLVAFYQFTREFWTHGFWKGNIILRLLLLGLGTVATSIVATIVTAPLVLMYFQQVPLLSMLANVLSAPAITFLVMPGTFLAYLLTPFPVLGDLSIHMMGLGVNIMMDVAHFVAALPSSVWRVPSLPLMIVIMMMTGLFMMMTLPRLGRYGGAALIVLALCCLPFQSRPDLYLTTDRVILYPDKANGVLYTEGRLAKFNRDMMLQWTAMKKVAPLPCDEAICDVTIKEKNIRFVRSVETLPQACEKKNERQPLVLLTRYFLDQSCDGIYVIDRHSLNRHGGYAVFLDKDDIRVETVHPRSGKRRIWNRPVWNAKIWKRFNNTGKKDK